MTSAFKPASRDGLDLAFWREMIMRHGSLVTVDRGELICRKSEPSVNLKG